VSLARLIITRCFFRFVTVIDLPDSATRADARPALDTRIDVSPLIGTWFGIKLDESRIGKLVISERDGVLLLHPYGTPESGLDDWGETEMTPHTASGSTTASGFHARCRVGAMRVEFVTVENQGVLLVQHFTSYHDDSGRPNEFAKSYFRRSAPELVSTSGISTGVITGEWENSNPATVWVSTFTITEDGGATTIRIRGASDPIDWGEAEINVHTDSHGEANLIATFDLEPFEVTIGVISVKNLVVLNQFRRYKDRGTVDSFCREFFFRNR
jgi:hypothetical protein